jgi:hypothetical protein
MSYPEKGKWPAKEPFNGRAENTAKAGLALDFGNGSLHGKKAKPLALARRPPPTALRELH